jgi:hypothetical protein
MMQLKTPYLLEARTDVEAAGCEDRLRPTGPGAVTGDKKPIS